MAAGSCRRTSGFQMISDNFVRTSVVHVDGFVLPGVPIADKETWGREG